MRPETENMLIDQPGPVIGMLASGEIGGRP